MEQLIMKTIPGLGIIIVAGGSSSRYGQKNKLFENLGGLPVFLHSIKNFAPFAEKDSLILVVPQGQKNSFAEQIEKYLPQTKVKLVSGGSCRTESVKNGLAALPPGTQIAAIHDAARPLADGRLLLDLVNTVQTGNCGAIAAEKMIDSVCRTDSENEREVRGSRSCLLHQLHGRAEMSERRLCNLVKCRQNCQSFAEQEYLLYSRQKSRKIRCLAGSRKEYYR